MNVSLSKELDSWVNEKVAGGLYNSSSEVVREGLRLLMEKERQKQALTESLRGDLALGIKELDEGRSRDFDSALVGEISRRGRDRLNNE